MKIDEAGSYGKFIPGARTTGLPLDSPEGWDYMHEPVAFGPRIFGKPWATSYMHEPVAFGPRIFGKPWATSFTQAQLNVREDLMMKLNTLQRMANVVKSLVSYKLDPGNEDKAHTGSTVVDLDYEFIPPLFNPDGSRNPSFVPGRCEIVGVNKKDILSSGLQTHGLQINPAELRYLEENKIIRTNPKDHNRYDISTQALVREMEKLKTGQGLDMGVKAITDIIQKGGKLSLGVSAR